MSALSEHNFVFATEPSGRLYRSLLDCGLRFCAKAILVIQPDLGLDSEAKQLLSDLCKLGCEVIERGVWSGTVLFNETARVYEIPYGAAAANLLADAVDGVFDWLQPRRPEDLCLLREDGSAWLTSIVHERDAFLTLRDEEVAVVERECSELHVALLLEHPG